MAFARRLLGAACLCLGARGQSHWLLQGSQNSLFCEVDSSNCIRTLEFLGGDYMGGGSCQFMVLEEDWSECQTIDVKDFDVDAGDSLTVNGVAYTGDYMMLMGASGDYVVPPVRPTGSIQWTGSNMNPSGRGFRLCPGSDSAACGGDGGWPPRWLILSATLAAGVLCLAVLIAGCLWMKGWCPKRRQEPPKAGRTIASGVVAPLPPAAPAREAEVVDATVVGAAVVGAAGPRRSPEDKPVMSEENPDLAAPAPGPVKKHFVEQLVRKGPVPDADAAAPSYWRSTGAETSGLVDVTPVEMLALQNMAWLTFKSVSTRDRGGEAMPKRLKVVMVKRNENARLWARYAAGRLGVQQAHFHKCVKVDDVYGGHVLTFKDLPPELRSETRADVNECFLWHGTSPEAAGLICQGGFDLTRAGSNVGSMYGPGAYFAECSSKSDEYASAGGGIYEGMFCLLLCRVVLGEVHMLTNAGEQVHGMVKASMESGAYDSVLGNRQAAVGTYREFVVYQEDQIYPEFVVVYQREM